ncbi:MAG: cyanophycinase [Dermatophilaceae bacterium]
MGRTAVLRRFVRLAGGSKARIVVIPTASSFPDDAVQTYTAIFSRLGAPEVVTVDPPSRPAASDDALVQAIDNATGVFMTGGNQLKLAQLFVGTPLADAISRAHTRGVVVAGTSAGASIMSRFMISLGADGVTPRQRAGQLTSGLGLLPGVIVDQHFDQRARYGRLMSLVASSPDLLGVGIDEDTAAEIRDGRMLTVLGSGAIFVIDARAAVSDVSEARRNAPVLVSGAVVHSLPTGATFDLQTASLVGFVEKHPDAIVKAAAKARGDSEDSGEAAHAGRTAPRRTH